MGRPVVHFEVNAKDGKAMSEFYKDLFEWEIDSNNPINYGMVAPGEGGIGGGIGQVDGGEGSWVTFYVAVPDLQASLDKAIELGGSIVMPVTEIPDIVTIAIFADPEGNRIGLVKG